MKARAYPGKCRRRFSSRSYQPRATAAWAWACTWPSSSSSPIAGVSASRIDRPGGRDSRCGSLQHPPERKARPMASPKLIAPIRTYEELDGAQGREVFFRPQRYRAIDLLPVYGEVLISPRGVPTVCMVHDVSQNGVAFEWPAGRVALVVGEMLVGVSFEGLLLQVDEILHLRSIKQFADNRAASQATWYSPGHERFKVLVSELQLFMLDAEEHFGRLEETLPWHVLHGDASPASPARMALIERLRAGFATDVVRMTEEIDAAVRSAPPAHGASLIDWSRRHLHRFFMQAPSMCRAYQKPFGYPGDYEVMRFIYERPFEGQTLFAKAISLAFDET